MHFDIRRHGAPTLIIVAIVVAIVLTWTNERMGDGEESLFNNGMIYDKIQLPSDTEFVKGCLSTYDSIVTR
ncbi:TPA: hypothetical protein HA265_06435, partial [Candidatus Woesearchaeota archaeon]|nr:hypothetical protein [Candidatus Woesearchaeota archaeon]